MKNPAALAVLLRRTQWLLDDAAHQLPRHECTTEELHSLATALEELARALRDAEATSSGE